MSSDIDNKSGLLVCYVSTRLTATGNRPETAAAIIFGGKMTLKHVALAALMVAGSATLSAQTAPRPEPGSDQRPVPDQRPKRGNLIDIFKAIAPPLIDAATSRPPPPPRQPVPEPVVEPAPEPLPEPVVDPAATPVPPVVRPPSIVAPEAAIVPAAPRPIPPRRRPIPPDPIPATSVRTPAPEAPAIPAPAPAPAQAQAPVSLPPVSAPATVPEVAPSPPIAEPVPPPTAVATGAAATSGRTDWWLLVLAAAALAIAATAFQKLRRMRQIAHTRAVLALDPRLDSAAGDCSTSGLAPTGPRISMHARLLPVGHG